MCDPTGGVATAAVVAPSLLSVGGATAGAATAATAGTSLLSTLSLGASAASAVGGVASAVMGAGAQNEQSAANSRAALDAYFLKTAQTNSRIRQEGVTAAQKKEDAASKAARSAGTAVAAAASGNVQGKSVQRLLEDYQRSEAIFADRTDQQLEATTAQLRGTMKGAQAEANQRIQSVPPAGMENIFGAALSGAGKLIGAADTYQARRKGEA